MVFYITETLCVRALRVMRRALTAFLITGMWPETSRKTSLLLSFSFFMVSEERVKGGSFHFWVLKE